MTLRISLCNNFNSGNRFQSEVVGLTKIKDKYLPKLSVDSSAKKLLLILSSKRVLSQMVIMMSFNL